MAGLINSNILTNPKTPLRRATAQRPGTGLYEGPVGVTAQALTATPMDQGSANLGAYYDEAGYHPGTPQPGSAGYYDESGSYHPGAGEGSYNEAGSWAPPKEAPTPQVSGTLPATPMPAAAPLHGWDAWANTPWESPKAARQPAIDKIVGEVGQVGKDFQDSIKDLVPGVGSRDWATWAAIPDTIPKRGLLEDPGAHETGYDEKKDELMATGDPKRQAIVDQLMKYGDLAEPDLDPWYDREWKRQQGDLNRQAAARGMYGSGDAMRMLHQSRESLAADQAKEMADYAMESMKNDVGRLGLAAEIQGGITGDDLERWGLAERWSRGAQNAEEGRVRGQTDDELAAAKAASSLVGSAFENMLDADWDLVMKWIEAGPGPSTNKANLEAQMNEQQKASIAVLGKIGLGGL